MGDLQSQPFTLNSTDKSKILKDLAYFFIVPVIFYVTALLGIIQASGHVISLKDFIPKNDTVVVIVAWILNQVLSVLRKYIA